jgi:hypothetical protein
MELSMKRRSMESTKMNTVHLPGVPDVVGVFADTGVTPPRLFGKCAGKTSSSLSQRKHKNTRRFTLVQAMRGDLT